MHSLIYKNNWGYWVLFTSLLASDYISKSWATQALANNTVIVILEHFLKLQLAHNTGAAWSLFSEQPVIVLSISLVFCIGLGFYSVFKLPTHPLQQIALACIFSGALGNLVNRLFLGKVIDFIDLDFIPNYPIFNLADCWIVIGVGILIVQLLLVSQPIKNP